MDDFDGLDPKIVFGHVQLLADAGYINASLMTYYTGEGGGEFMINSMPWDGHDLLAQMRSETIWQRIKATAKSKGIELTFDAVKALSKLALEQVINS